MKKRIISSILIMSMFAVLTACGKQDGEVAESSEEKSTTSDEAPSVEEIPDVVLTESGVDGQFDWDGLQAENPDIYGWLFVPDTDIDFPLVCSLESEDYYESHDATGAENTEGTPYTQFYNYIDMCDFNTVVYGKTDESGSKGAFSALYQFADSEYFDKHTTFYIYLPEGRLTYQIIAAYERTNDNVLAIYDTTTEDGCQKFINEEYLNKSMSGNYREGWEGISPYHFLVSLTTSLGGSADKQFVVMGILIDDQTGTINRDVIVQ